MPEQSEPVLFLPTAQLFDCLALVTYCDARLAIAKGVQNCWDEHNTGSVNAIESTVIKILVV